MLFVRSDYHKALFATVCTRPHLPKTGCGNSFGLGWKVNWRMACRWGLNNDRQSSSEARDISKGSKHEEWNSCTRSYLHRLNTYLAKWCLLYLRIVPLAKMGKASKMITQLVSFVRFTVIASSVHSALLFIQENNSESYFKEA